MSTSKALRVRTSNGEKRKAKQRAELGAYNDAYLSSKNLGLAKYN
jgi:hypothetical protein